MPGDRSTGNGRACPYAAWLIGIPKRFARRTVERDGEAGAAWLAELPATVDELLAGWDCTPDGEVMHGGVGVIIPVRRPAGSAALKVSFPHPGNVHEPDAFEAWGGRGAVLLYERDDEHYAMLLERARASTLADVDAWMEQLRRDSEELAHTLSPHVVDAALATIRDLGRDQPDIVIHGDLHARNILRADRETWLAVDPKGYVGDPAYDGGAVLKSRAVALIGADDLCRSVDRTLDVFAEAAELDRERARRWSRLHAVQAAFHGRRYGFRMARSGSRLDRLTDLAERLAALLTAARV